MQYGFIKVAAGSPRLTVADVDANAASIREMIFRANAGGSNLLVLPELCLTGYTCGDLFYSETLLNAAKNALIERTESTKGLLSAVVIGLPLRVRGKLYNCAAVLQGGRILGMIPKTYLPNYGEFYELRQFTPASDPTRPNQLFIGGQTVRFPKSCCLNARKSRNLRFPLKSAKTCGRRIRRRAGSVRRAQR